MSKQPRCPCGRKGKPVGGQQYRCEIGHLYDASPEEGGDFDDRDPSRRAERVDEISKARRLNAEQDGKRRSGFRF